MRSIFGPRFERALVRSIFGPRFERALVRSIFGPRFERALVRSGLARLIKHRDNSARATWPRYATQAAFMNQRATCNTTADKLNDIRAWSGTRRHCKTTPHPFDRRARNSFNTLITRRNPVEVKVNANGSPSCSKVCHRIDPIRLDRNSINIFHINIYGHRCISRIRNRIMRAHFEHSLRC